MNQILRETQNMSVNQNIDENHRIIVNQCGYETQCESVNQYLNEIQNYDVNQMPN